MWTSSIRRARHSGFKLIVMSPGFESLFRPFFSVIMFMGSSRTRTWSTRPGGGGGQPSSWLQPPPAPAKPKVVIHSAAGENLALYFTIFSPAYICISSSPLRLYFYITAQQIWYPGAEPISSARNERVQLVGRVARSRPPASGRTQPRLHSRVDLLAVTAAHNAS